jgi:hypothetical protein
LVVKEGDKGVFKENNPRCKSTPKSEFIDLRKIPWDKLAKHCFKRDCSTDPCIESGREDLKEKASFDVNPFDFF